MENIIEKIEYKGYEIEIFQSDYPEDPRGWDNLGTMICFHNRYDLGDKHNYYDPDEFIEDMKNEKVIILPLYLYDHSGITISTGPFGCPWDSGQVGYIYVTYEDIKKEFSYKNITTKRIEKIKDYLRGEVETYDNYLTGNIYGYNIEDVDSCSGYFGDPEKSGLLDEAKDIIDYEIEHNLKNHLSLLKQWIKKSVPLDKRYKFQTA